MYLQVSDRDTLRSIAAIFDTTPSELKKLNKLMSDMVFPGKVNFFAFSFELESDLEHSFGLRKWHKNSISNIEILSKVLF